MENFPNNSDFEQDIEPVVDDTQESVEQEADKIADERNRKVGAKILNAVGFRGRHQETVDRSFGMARSKEHLVGKNDERRIDAYLKRISRDIEKKW